MAFDGIFVSIQIIWCYVIAIDGTFLEKYKKKHREKRVRACVPGEIKEMRYEVYNVNWILPNITALFSDQNRKNGRNEISKWNICKYSFDYSNTFIPCF